MRNAKSSSVQHQIYIYEGELITQAANWEDQPASQPEQMIRHKCESIIPSTIQNRNLTSQPLEIYNIKPAKNIRILSNIENSHKHMHTR